MKYQKILLYVTLILLIHSNFNKQIFQENQHEKNVKKIYIENQFQALERLSTQNCFIYKFGNYLTIKQQQIQNIQCSADYLIQTNISSDKYEVECVSKNSIQFCHVQINWPEKLCLQCRDNYQIDQNKQKCKKVKHVQMQQDDKCLMCKNQYYLQNQQCFKCQENCQICHPFEKEKCLQCLEEFTKNENFCEHDKSEFMSLKNIAQILNWKKLIILMVGVVIFN